MKHIPATSRPTNQADPDTFVLSATTQALIGRADDLPLRMYRVAFDPGARMSWHRHDGPQLLVGLSGVCVVETRDGRRVALEEGDVVVIEPEEEHWHGAPVDAGGAHLAINLGGETVWMERPPEE